MTLEILDLRKAKCLKVIDSDESFTNLHVDSHRMLTINCLPYTMYMIMSSRKETEVFAIEAQYTNFNYNHIIFVQIWCDILRGVAHNNGPSLKDQQLTGDDVPVLVEKCIDFVYRFG